MMESRFLFCFCFLAATAAAGPKIKLEFDRPSVRISISDAALLQCCFRSNLKPHVTWIRNTMDSTKEFKVVNLSDGRLINFSNDTKDDDMQCYSLKLQNVILNDTGLYQCSLNSTDGSVLTPGTFVQVYVPISKNLNINEKVKNSIITAEGVLLLLCMLFPGFLLFCKQKSFNGLQKKKDKEEENIYEGLNLDECSTYHQIQRSQVQGPYQDVMNTMEEDVQLEKP